MELKFKKCLKCGALINVFEDSKTDFICCSEKMVDVKPNTLEASFEKHIPNYEIKDLEIEVFVNYVMDNDHYIEWIMYQTDKESIKITFKPGDTLKVKFKYQKKALLYSYCNKHGLWMKEVL